jgi:glutathione S-transferase
VPVLELDGGVMIPESGAILLYLADGSPFLADDRLSRARVHQWMFFEQNLLEPNVGTARFWRLTGRATQRPEVFEQRVEAGNAALEVLNRGLADREFLVDDQYTVADIALYAYTHAAGEGSFDLAEYPAIGPWLARVEATDGFANDLEPYAANAQLAG